MNVLPNRILRTKINFKEDDTMGVLNVKSQK